MKNWANKKDQTTFFTPLTNGYLSSFSFIKTRDTMWMDID